MRALLTAVVIAGLAACEGGSRPTAPNDYSLTPASEREGGRLQADNLQAEVTFTHIHARFRECEGEDGHYFETDHTVTGTSTGDPRLTGQIEVRLQDIFNSTEELGPEKGSIVIRDATTGREKAEGEYSAWGPAEFAQGTIVGRVDDEGAGSEVTRGGGTLIANWRITNTPAFIAQIGGATTDNRLPAGVWSGKGCKGKFTELDIDLGAPTAAAAAAGGGRNWRRPRP